MRNDTNKILAENAIRSMLLYADRPKDLALYYLTRFCSLGPTVYLRKIDEDPLLIVVPMEVDRARNESLVQNVKSYLDCESIDLVKSASDQRIGLMRFIAAVAKKELDAKKLIYVPPNLSIMAADVLRHEGLKITPLFDVIERARETKESDEIEAIQFLQKVTETAMNKAIEFIADSEVGLENSLHYRENGAKTVLTVGKIRSIVNQVFCDENVFAEEGETQIACGLRAADPNYAGESSDILKADEPIILDFFPKGVKTLYHTDMARTIVKGRASRQVKSMFETVAEAKAAAIDAVKAEVSGSDVETSVFDILEKAGYQTMKGGKEISNGLLHNVGHGVGLDSNELPIIDGLRNSTLKEHSIVTVELGLYDPDVGGVRIEDILEITRNGSRNLTRMKVYLEV